MRLLLSVTLALAALAAPAPARAQTSHTVVARDSAAVMYRVADGVFAILHDDAVHNYPDGSVNWPHSNVGVIVGSRDVMVVDANFYPSRADADIRLIRQVTSKPVRYLVNTHWHGDHTHGNAVYRKTFARLEIVSARANAHFISLNQERFGRSVIREGSTVRRLLAAHEADRARGADSAGKPIPDSLRPLLHRVIAEERTWLAEFAKIETAPPTRLFDSTLTIDLGGKVVRLRNWGRANSPADVTVWLPRERVLFTGDVVVHPVPYVFGAWPAPWIGVLKSLEAIPATAIVPGHGPVLPDHSYTRLVRQLFEAAAVRMDSLLRTGLTQAEAQRALDLSDFRPRFVRAGDVNAAAYWEAAIVNGLTERTYQCVVGSRC